MKRLLFVSQFGKIMQESRRAREFLVRHKGSLFYIFLDIFYNKNSIHVVFFILFFVKQSQRQRRVDPFRKDYDAFPANEPGFSRGNRGREQRMLRKEVLTV